MRVIINKNTNNNTNKNKKEFGKVAVLLGGRSPERAISLQTGEEILSALLRQGVDAHPIDPDESLTQKLLEGKFDRVYIALHGKEGEDGVIQGVIQMLGLPFTGSGVAASALAMDKAKAKLVMRGLGVSTPIFGVAKTLEKASEIAKNIGFPVAVKPNDAGSSLGVTRVVNAEMLPKAFIEAQAVNGSDVIVEKWIEGREFFVGIIGDKVLPSIEVQVSGEFFDYHAKYESENTKRFCPSPLPVASENEIRALASDAFYELGCEGWGRVDFILDEQQKFWVLEVNTIPGMTSHSLVPVSAAVVGISFDDLVMTILETTIAEQQVKNKVMKIA